MNGMQHRQSDEDRLEDALRARASLAGQAATGGDVLEGPAFGNAYRLGGLKDFGDDLAVDNDLLDEHVDIEDLGGAESAPQT